MKKDNSTLRIYQVVKKEDYQLQWHLQEDQKL
jgi:hypothetical protein